MSVRHADDQELCRQLPGVCVGKLCDACEGRCPICDSRSNPMKPVHVCDACAGAERYSSFESLDFQQLQEQTEQHQKTVRERNAGASSVSDNILDGFSGRAGAPASSPNKCIICLGHGAKHTAFYCRACVLLEKDRDGCPRTKFRSNAQHQSKARRK